MCYPAISAVIKIVILLFYRNNFNIEKQDGGIDSSPDIVIA